MQTGAILVRMVASVFTPLSGALYGANAIFRPVAFDLGCVGDAPTRHSDAAKSDLRDGRCSRGGLCRVLRAIAFVSGPPARHAALCAVITMPKACLASIRCRVMGKFAMFWTHRTRAAGRAVLAGAELDHHTRKRLLRILVEHRQRRDVEDVQRHSWGHQLSGCPQEGLVMRCSAQTTGDSQYVERVGSCHRNDSGFHA
jgi:hypothetical protein